MSSHQPCRPTSGLTSYTVHSSEHIHLFKLTVCWEANFESEKQRKEGKYLQLLEEAHSNRAAVMLSTIQVGCRGFIDISGLHVCVHVSSK